MYMCIYITLYMYLLGEYDPERMAMDYQKRHANAFHPRSTREQERIEHDNRVLLAHLENAKGFLNFKEFVYVYIYILMYVCIDV